MSIFSGSRYATAKITPLLMPNGSVRKYVHSREVMQKSELGSKSSIVFFTRGMEFDAMAFSAYTSEKLWWVLADVNEVLFPLFDESLLGPNQLQVGNNILIPNPSQLSKVVSIG